MYNVVAPTVETPEMALEKLSEMHFGLVGVGKNKKYYGKRVQGMPK